MTRKVIVDLK